MASLENTIKIIFDGTDNVSGVVNGVAGSVEGFAGKVDGFTQPFASLAKGIIAVDGAVNTALLALGGFSIAAAGNFKGGMNEIKSLLDERTTDLEQFGKDVQGFIGTTAQPIDEVLGAAYEAISQGIPAESIAAFLASADKLATAGKSSLVEAVNLLAGTANAYGGTINDVNGYADIFFTAVKDGKTTIPDLANAVGNVTSIAAPFGVSVGEVAGSIAALTAYGVPSTEQAATIIKQMIQGLVNPTDAAAKAAASLGISLGADVFKSKTLPEVIKEIGEKTGFSAGKIAEMFTSVESLQGILPLMNDPAGKFAKVMADIAESSGAADKAYALMVGNFDLMNQRLVNGIKTVLIDIGKPLLDDYAGAVMGLDGIFKAIDLSLGAGALAPLTDYFGRVLSDLGALASDIAEVLPAALSNIDWGGVEQSFDNIQGAVEAVFQAIFGEDIDITSAEGLGRVLQGVVDAFAGLNNLNAGIISALPEFFAVVSDFIKGVADTDPDTILGIGKALGVLFAVNVGAGAVSNLAGAVSALGALGALDAAGIAATLAAAAPVLGGVALGGAYFMPENEGTKAFDDFWLNLWDRGDKDKVAEITEDIATIPAAAVEAAFEFKAIEWELDAEGNIAGSVGAANAAIDTLFDGADDNFNDLKSYYISLGNSPNIIAAMDKIVKQTGRIPGAMENAKDKTKEESDQLIADLARIASDERLKALEFSFELDQTALQGEIDKALAIIGTLDTEIQSTGALLGSLFGDLADSGSGEFQKKWAIEEQINKENAIRQTAADDAHKAAEQQLKLNELRIERAESGDALWTVKMEGMEADTETLLRSLVERLQIWVNEEADPTLLG